MTERYWKVLGPNRTAHHGGRGQWHPQAWMPTIPNPEPCARGYHLCRRGDLVKWLGPEIWEAKAGDVVVEHGDKVVTDRARLIRRLDTWNDRTARLFAADCAERALVREREAGREPDARLWAAVVAARAYTNGEIDNAARAAALAAARDAARDAARNDAMDAAWDAERAWQTDRLMTYLYPNGEPT